MKNAAPMKMPRRFVVTFAMLMLGLCVPLSALTISGGIEGNFGAISAAPSVGCACGCALGCDTGACGCSDEVPLPIDGTAGLTPAQTSFTVSPVGSSAYNISGTNNPTLTLTRGVTYTFNISASGHPFYIKTLQSTGTGNAFNTGVTGNGMTSGTLTFTVPDTAPNTLFYDCANHIAMTGTINIVSAPEPGSLALSRARSCWCDGVRAMLPAVRRFLSQRNGTEGGRPNFMTFRTSGSVSGRRKMS